jgi:hypothetical protein
MGGSMAAIKSEAAKLLTIEKGAAGKPDIRMFDVASINDHITRSLSVLKPEEKVAFVAYADGQGVKGAIVGRLDAGPGEMCWTVFTEKPYDGPFTWGAGVTWKF